jgi:CelD/BcsL family acetyltransferase involved in cellulose biosynthesis
VTEGDLSFELVKTDSDFDSLEGEWGDLLADSHADPLFCSFPWMRTWWRAGQHAGKLRILCARDETGSLVGIAPMYLSSMTALELEKEMVGDVRLIVPTKGGKYDVLAPLGNGEVCSDFTGFIAVKNRTDEIWSALYTTLHRKVRGFDIFNLRDTDERTPGLEGLQYAAMGARHSRYRTIYRAPYAPLPGTYDDYLNTLSKKSRYNARKKLKMISIYHKVEHSFHSDPETLDAAMDTFFALHAERWTADGLTGVFSTPTMAAFHKAMAKEGLARGWLRLGVMTIDGEPSFMTYAYQVGDRVYLYQQGSTVKYEKFNLGYAALGFAIQDACERGAKQYDFLRGEAEYKLHWAKESRQLIQFTAFRSLRASRFYARSFINTDPKVRSVVKKLIRR